MKVIQVEAMRQFNGRGNASASELQVFVERHRLYRPNMPLSTLLESISEGLKKKSPSGSRGQKSWEEEWRKESLRQLGLYLNQDNNKQIFGLFDHILNNPEGITYEALARKLKTDIITVSHYCCKLKRLRLVDWEHEKEGVVVSPRIASDSIRPPRNLQIEHKKRGKQPASISFSLPRVELTYDLKQSLLFQELSMNENIWLNISSQESLARGGFTNEEIKKKIMKHAENKMVRRTVESMKFFQKSAERQGKVFQFRYKNETESMKEELAREKEEQREPESEIETLEEGVLDWLKRQFPEFRGEEFLLELINQKFKDYLSILGVKQSKRQCTPLKLNRYIKVLNYLHREGGMRESELRALIVKDQQKLNIGVMHKRSLMGILEGLKSLNIVFEDEGVYYPGWIQKNSRVRKQSSRLARDDSVQENPKKKIHHDPSREVRKAPKGSKESKPNGGGRREESVSFKKISQKRHKFELFTGIFSINIQKGLERCYRKAFNSIVYAERRTVFSKYKPQLNVLSLLEQNDKQEFSFGSNIEGFYQGLDALIEERGEEAAEVPDTDYEVIKFVRRTPSKSAGFLRIKYGKGWEGRMRELEEKGMVQVAPEGCCTSKEELLI